MTDWQESKRQTRQTIDDDDDDEFYDYDDPRDPTVRLIEEGIRHQRKAQKAMHKYEAQQSGHSACLSIVMVIGAIVLVAITRGCGY